ERMRSCHSTPEGIGECLVNSAGVGQVVKRLAVVETTHLDDPFDRLAFSVDCEPAVRLARDRVCAAVNCRGVGAVDGDLGFAGGSTPSQSGKIEKGKAHRSLDLECAISGQKKRRSVGVDAFDWRTTMRGWIA